MKKFTLKSGNKPSGFKMMGSSPAKEVEKEEEGGDEGEKGPGVGAKIASAAGEAVLSGMEKGMNKKNTYSEAPKMTGNFGRS